MPGPEFFQTQMGHAFYGGTMPSIAHELKRIADSLALLTKTDWEELVQKVSHPLFEARDFDADKAASKKEGLIEKTRKLNKLLSGHQEQLLAFRDNVMMILGNINWPILDRQKEELLNVRYLDEKNPDPLEGIITLLSELQEAARDAGIWKPAKP